MPRSIGLNRGRADNQMIAVTVKGASLSGRNSGVTPESCDCGLQLSPNVP